MSNPLIMNVDFGGAVGLINLGPFLLNKFEINLPYHNSTWGAIKSSAKFTLTDLTNEVYGYFIDYIDNYIPVQVYLDTVRIFRGYIRNNASFTTNEGLDDISLELIDRSKELDVTLEETISLENAKICDTATPASSVIHQLIYASGYADALAFGITLEAFGIVDGADYNAFGIENADLSLLTDIDISIDYYFKSKFDDHNIYKLIQDILFEAGYVLIVTATGEPYFASIIGRGETPTTTTFYDKKIFKGFKWRKQDVKFDSVTMKYYDHDLIENAVVFNDTTGGNDLYDCIIPVPATTSYPVDAELPATITKLDFAVNTPDLTDPTAVNKRDLIVAIQLGAEVDVRPGSFFNPAKAISDDTWYGTSLDSGAYNADSAGHNLIRFQVIADAIVKGDMHEYIAKKQLVSKYSNKDVELEHITDAANAKVLADGLLDNYVYGKKVFNFNTTESLVLGNYYIVTDGAYTGAAYNFKVIRKTPVYVWTKAYGLAIYYYKYECLSYGVLAAIDTGGGSTTGRTVTRARRIFRDTLFEAEVPAVINPEAPYFLLDLWIKDDGYYECTTARASGDAYVDGDFTIREINPAEVPLALLHDPARLGAILESPTPDDVFLHAIDHTGANILDEDGKVMFDGVYKTVPYGAVTVADGTWYMFKETAGGTVQLAQYDFTDARFEVGAAAMTAGFFFAEVIAAGGTVTNIEIYQTAKSEAEMVAHYKRLTMQILAAAAVGDFGSIATGLGIEAAFTSLAVYSAFIVDLIVQKFLATKVDGANTFLLYADIVNGLKMKYGTTGTEDTLFHAAINGDVALGNYDGGAGAKWIQSTKKFSIKGDGLWEGDIATGFIETVDGYTFTLTTANDEATKFAEFNLVNLLAKGALSSAGNLTHIAPLSVSSKTSPVITFFLDAFSAYDLSLTNVGKNGNATSFASWDVADLIDGPGGSAVVFIAGVLAVTIGNIEILGHGLASTNWFWGLYSGGTADVELYKWTSGPAASVYNNIKSMQKNLGKDIYIVGDGGYIGWWEFLGVSTFAAGTDYHSVNTTGLDDWHGVGHYYYYVSAFVTYAPIILGDGGKICVVTTATTTLSYTIRTVSTKSWRYGTYHTVYGYSLIIATDGTVAVSDDEFATFDIYTGPFTSGVNDVYYDKDTERIYAIDDDTIYYTEDCYNWIEVTSTTGISDQKKIGKIDFGATYDELYIVDSGSDFYSSVQSAENITITAMKRSTVEGSLRIDVSEDASAYTYDDEDAIFMRDVTKNPFNELSAEFDDKLVIRKKILLDGVEIEEF